MEMSNEAAVQKFVLERDFYFQSVTFYGDIPKKMWDLLLNTLEDCS